MKQCKKCEKILPLSSFYTHKKTKDGRISSCKNCKKRQSTDYRNKNIEKVRLYDRERSKLKHSIERRKITTSKWIIKHPKARHAQIKLNNAKRSGIIKEKPCEVCGIKNVHAHHCDYNKPLDVMWLCPEHHKKWHQENEPIF